MPTSHFHSVLLSDRAIRLRKLERMLRPGGVVPCRRLQSVAGASIATFKRDLDCLRLDFGARIAYVPAEFGYRLENLDWPGVLPALVDELRRV